MRKTIKALSALAMAAALCMGLATAAAASEQPAVTFGDKQITITGVGEYADTDLFGAFKGVYPGDVLEQGIDVENASASGQAVDVWMRAVAHDEAANPLTYDEAAEAADGNDQAGVEGQRDETVATMGDFLSKLTMTVRAGERVIFQGPASETGGLSSDVHLATLENGESCRLTVTLEVPAELGNEYANRVGEVDWVFTFAEYDELIDIPVVKRWDDEGDKDGIRPAAITVRLLADGEEVASMRITEADAVGDGTGWAATFEGVQKYAADGHELAFSVVEDEVKGYEATYSGDAASGFAIDNFHEPEEELAETGDSLPVGLIAGVAGIAAACLVLALVMRRRSGN